MVPAIEATCTPSNIWSYNETIVMHELGRGVNLH